MQTKDVASLNPGDVVIVSDDGEAREVFDSYKTGHAQTYRIDYTDGSYSLGHQPSDMLFLAN